MRKLIAAVLATFAIMACDSSSAPDLTPYAGNYVLRSVNDTLLPYTVATQANYRLEIASDTIFMAVNGAFVDVTHYRRADTGVIDFPADSLGGAWSVVGSTVTYHAVTGDVFSANISGSTITIIGSGAKAIYTK